MPAARVVFDVKFNLLKRHLIVVLLMLSAAPAVVAAPPSTQPVTQPATRPLVRPASRPSTQPTAARPSTQPIAAKPSTQPAATSQPAVDPKVAQARKLLDLTRRSIRLLESKKWKEAEAALQQALVIDPEEPTNLYNMACLKALTGHKDDALVYLEKSADAGFTDFIHISQDTDLTTLREEPRYKAFIAKKDVYQRKFADLAVAELKKRFGDEYLYEIDEADKLIFATNTDRPTLDSLKANLVRQAKSQWDQLFEHKPDQYIAVVVPSPSDYRKILRQLHMPQGVEGFYNHASRTLIAAGLGFVTMHEFTHALHASDLDPLGQEHPIWLVEGMAVLFESTEYDGDVLTPKDNMRVKDVQSAARQNRLVPLEKLLKMEQRDFVNMNNVMLDYAEAGSVIHYLYDQGLLRKFYDTYKADYDKDKTGKIAIEKVSGKPLVDFEKDWKEWMLRRTPAPRWVGSDGPYLGVRFGEANDGLLVQTVVAGGPGYKAGLKPGDTIVGLDEIEVRDQPTFTSMMVNHKPGETVILKLRRNHAYLEMPIVLGRRNDPASGGAATRPSGTISIKPATRPSK